MKRGRKRRGIGLPAIALALPGLIAAGAADVVSAVELESFEQRLLEATDIRFDFVITAEGAIEASLRGSLEVASDRVHLAASGEFAGESVDLSLRSDGRELELGNGTDERTVAAPPTLKEALVIGLTRMGILHNLARLTEAAPPDHADGGVREWVTVASAEGEGEAETAGEIAFDLIVAGKPAGSATLVIDAGGRPTVRRQTVEFPSGQMRVVERYSAFSIAP